MWSCAAGTSFRPPRCRTRRPTPRSTTAASSRRRWTRRSRWPTGRASRRRRAASERAGRLRGIGMCCFLEVAGGILDEVVDLRFEADGRVRAAHRRAGDGAGAPHDLRAVNRHEARRAARGGAANRGRQRRGAGYHPERRLALADDGGQRHRARLRRGDREGPRAGRRGAGGRRGRPRVQRRALPGGGHRPRRRHARLALAQREGANSTRSPSSSRRR